jgi:hypothetical protein
MIFRALVSLAPGLFFDAVPEWLSPLTSLLAFDERRRKEPENLRTVYGLTSIPCDSQMRAILDGVELAFRRAACSANSSAARRSSR